MRQIPLFWYCFNWLFDSVNCAFIFFMHSLYNHFPGCVISTNPEEKLFGQHDVACAFGWGTSYCCCVWTVVTYIFFTKYLASTYLGKSNFLSLGKWLFHSWFHALVSYASWPKHLFDWIIILRCWHNESCCSNYFKLAFFYDVYMLCRFTLVVYVVIPQKCFFAEEMIHSINLGSSPMAKMRYLKKEINLSL